MEPAETSEVRVNAEVPSELESLLAELWQSSSAPGLGIAREEFARLLFAVGKRYGFGQPDKNPDAREQIPFLRQLHIEDLVLAHACALGVEAAWEQFLARYREPLYRAACSISGSDAAGRELADSLYAELFGLRERDGQRQSPLRSYHGRGSLAGWLRATLAQRHVDRYRRQRRETPLDEEQEPAAASNPEAEFAGTAAAQPAALEKAVRQALGELGAEDRLLIAAYYFDGRTVRELGVLLGVHASTISRRLERLYALVRKRILRELRAGGLSLRQAEEMMQSDVRDVAGNLDLPLKKILQFSPSGAFQSGAFQSGEVIRAEGGRGDA
jgi:RNA polymerase sigma-70 factor, ECF subfamily